MEAALSAKNAATSIPEKVMKTNMSPSEKKIIITIIISDADAGALPLCSVLKITNKTTKLLSGKCVCPGGGGGGTDEQFRLGRQNG